ncbi:MAG: prolipoprotein diacylglyceryl transferase [Myxococcales bacterium]|nr:prolipoprotein diacylglyceryl transferase [Myxococcales bacterium]
MTLHALFDILAWSLSAATAWWVRRHWLPATPTVRSLPYLASLIVGVCLGAYLLGSVNLLLAGQMRLGRSVLGALLGGSLTVEVYKRGIGLQASTGAIWALPFAVGVAVGRVGCQLSGLDDATFGIPSDVPWAIALADGIPRHPVALYESVMMGLFSIGLGWGLARRRVWATEGGFALLALFYGAQRFFWEGLKPFPQLLGPLSLMQLACLLLVGYGAWLWRHHRRSGATPQSQAGPQ